jgi:DNA repair exonuclease SbcCD nuclease subunit
VAGDFFDQPRPGPFLERWVIELLKEYDIRPVVVPGQHDMPGHSLDQLSDSGLGVLAAARVIDLMSDVDNFRQWSIHSIYGQPYGTQVDLKSGIDPHPDGSRILLWHHMVINKPLWPGQEADKAPAILCKYPQFDIIAVGDNHTTFAIAAPDGRWLINPGSMMRMTAAQVGHRPCVFKWENGKLEQIFLPIAPDVLDLTDLERAKEKDSRITAFVESLDKQYEIGLGYEKNLEEHMKINRTSSEVQKIVWECLENG